MSHDPARLTQFVRPMQPFEFHGDLFELRGAVLDALAAQGFVWMSDFGSVDLSHDTYGLEVTGIQEEERATQVHQLLQKLFPKWRFHRQYYEDRNIGEVGWKVIISREREKLGGTWRPGGGSSRPDLSKLDFVKAGLAFTERTAGTTSKQLLNPDLTDAKRAQLETYLDRLREWKRRDEILIRKLQEDERRDE